MAMPIGTIDSDGRRYFRCTECGDSKKRPYIAHAFVDKNGSTYCYRCQHSSRLTSQQFVDYLLGDTTVDEILDGTWGMEETLARMDTGRKTLLTKYDYNGSAAFAMRNQHNILTGWHIRPNNSKGIDRGTKGISWPGADDGYPLISSPERPLVAVEGCWDVLQDNSVSMFGSIAYNSLRQLRYQHVVLWPDPDVLDTPKKKVSFVDMMQKANDNLCFVQGLIVSNADPDKATKTKFIPLKEAIQKVRQYV